MIELILAIVMALISYLMLRKQRLASFAVRGLGLSTQVRALDFPAFDERQSITANAGKEING